MQTAVFTTCIIATCLLCGCVAQRRAFTYEQKPSMFAGILGNGGMVGNDGLTRNGGLTGNGGLTRNGGLTGNDGLTRNGGLTGNGGLTRNGRLTGNADLVRNGGIGAGIQSLLIQPTQVPDCPLEIHPDTETMFIMRSAHGDPLPRTCPPGTYFLRSLCSCVNRPLDSKECNLRPSAIGQGWYEEKVFDVWVQRPCGPGSAYNPSTCDCSFTL